MRQKSVREKMGLLIMLAAILIAGVYGYAAMEGTIKNFKGAYLTEIYMPIWKRSLTSWRGVFSASLFNSSAQGKSVVSSQTDNERKEARTIPVLLYHGIVTEENGSDVLVSNFRKQMFALKEAGYETITMREFVDFIKNGKRLPEKSFLLTFDDGRRDSYYPVDPILKALDYSAVMFIIAKRSLKEDTYYYLSFPELQRMKASGHWELQPHGYDSHDSISVDALGSQGNFFSSKMWLSEQNRIETTEEYRNRAREELRKAKRAMENAVGERAISFSFPLGEFGDQSELFPEINGIALEEAAKEYPVSFVEAWTGERKTNAREFDSFLMRRVEVRPRWDEKDVLAEFEALRDKEAFYTDMFEEDKGWDVSWGKVEVKDGILELSPGEDGVSAATILQGTTFWKNYRVIARGELVKGSTLSVMARYRDKNYVSCTYGTDGQVRLEEEVEGVRSLLGTSDGTIQFRLGLEHEIGMYVEGDRAGCLFNGRIVSPISSINGALGEGGIGFKTWGSEEKGNLARIKEVRVEEVGN